MLTDPQADQQLQRDGYVVIDLLGPDEVASLVTAWELIESQWEPQWDPTGLAVTIRHPELAIRADSALQPTIATALAPRVEDCGPFLGAFLLKRAHSDELPAHLDWRLLDEKEEFTHGCWVPLEDVTATNGGLGVFPGSHRLVEFDRTPASPGHDWVLSYLDGHPESVVLELTAGQAVIYDHRLVHFSPPNTTSNRRLAVNTGLAPPHRTTLARDLVLAMMAQGMAGQGTAPQIPTSPA